MSNWHKNNIFVIGNWKSYLDFRESINLFKRLEKKMYYHPFLEAVICSSFPVVTALREYSSLINVGAQDLSAYGRGAYTGEVMAKILKQVGCKYVIIGHSERRKFQQESDELINEKMKVAIKAKLIPILCIGESYEERKRGLTKRILRTQLKKALKDVDLSKRRILIAYEPVWAISSTGRGSSIDIVDLKDIVKYILKVINRLYSEDIIKNKVRILYGGSVNSRNVKKYFLAKNIAGVLVGSASTKYKEYIKMLNIAGEI